MLLIFLVIPFLLVLNHLLYKSTDPFSPLQILQTSIMAQLDPTWPAGYPFEAIYDFEDRHRGVSMPKGTKGKVVSRSGDWIYVTFPFAKPPSKGWVPFNRLKIGTQKYGNTTVTIQMPKFRGTAQLTAAMNQQSRLRRALDAYFITLRDNVEDLHFLPAWFVERLRSDTARLGMVNSIMSGMRTTVLNVLNKSNFTIQELRMALDPVDPRDSRPGIYTRIYFDFKPGPDGVRPLPSQYVGKSKNVGSRETGHTNIVEDEEKETNSNHYRKARKAGSYIMGVLCYLNDPQMRTVAEQCFVSLLETYSDAVITFEPKVSLQEPDNPEEIARDTMKYYQDKEAASILQKLARMSFQVSGWGGGRSRQSYGTGDGCNWNSPITEREKGERIIWTKMTFEMDKNLEIYSRTPVQVRSDGVRQCRFYVTMELPSAATLPTRGTFSPHIPSHINLPPGTWVFPVIEMTADASPHPFSWCRLPSQGPWYDWDLAKSWALKIEWQDRENERWYSYYIVSSSIFEFRTPQLREPGAFNTYSHAIAIFRSLRQLDLSPQGRPQWLYDYGVSRQKVMDFDWLNQRLSVRDTVVKNRIVTHRGPKTLFEMQYDMRRVGLHVLWNTFGLLDRPSIRQRQPPGACDSCYLHNLRDRRFGNQSVCDFNLASV